MASACDNGRKAHTTDSVNTKTTHVALSPDALDYEPRCLIARKINSEALHNDQIT